MEHITVQLADGTTVTHHADSFDVLPDGPAKALEVVKDQQRVAYYRHGGWLAAYDADSVCDADRLADIIKAASAPDLFALIIDGPRRQARTRPGEGKTQDKATPDGQKAQAADGKQA